MKLFSKLFWFVVIRAVIVLSIFFLLKESLKLVVHQESIERSYFYLLPVTVLLLSILSLPLFFKKAFEYRFNKEFLFWWVLFSLLYVQVYFRLDEWSEFPAGHWFLFAFNYLLLTGVIAVWYKKDKVKFW